MLKTPAPNYRGWRTTTTSTELLFLQQSGSLQSRRPVAVSDCRPRKGVGRMWTRSGTKNSLDRVVIPP